MITPSGAESFGNDRARRSVRLGRRGQRLWNTVAVNEQDPTLRRLEDQIDWYDKKSLHSQRRFKLLKATQLFAAALIPALAPLDVYPAILAALGALIIVLEGFQQLNQYQQNWSSYRSTCESLKHEKFLFLAEAGPYAQAQRPRALLADRIEGLISQEHAKWVSAREDSSRALAGGGQRE